MADPGKKQSWQPARYLSGCGIPVVGVITAGNPIETVENIVEELKIDPEVFGCDKCIGIRLRGGSCRRCSDRGDPEDCSAHQYRFDIKIC